MSDNIAGYRIVRRVFSDPRGEIAIATPEQAPRFAEKVVLRISPFSALGSEVSVREYMRRAALYATLSHSAILQAYELSTANESVVLVLEHTEGLALDDFRASLDTMGVEIPDDVVLYLGLRIFGALTAAHAARDPGDGSHTPVVHGNVRPECVLVPWDGYVRLAEFEVARISAVWRGVDAAQRPTPSRYMAPEQVNSGLASVKTDIYSAALVLWELLTKMVAVPPSLSGSSLARAMAKPKYAPLGRVRPDLPPRLIAAMERALAPAAQRTVTAPEMLGVLRELVRPDEAEPKLLQLLERIRSAPTLGSSRRKSASAIADANDALEQVSAADLLEETAIDPSGVDTPQTQPPSAAPPPLPRSASKIPRPRTTPAGGTPATVGEGAKTTPAPPPEQPEPIPGSERIPRIRESSGRIGLLDWSATSSSEIPAAPPPLEAELPEPPMPGRADGTGALHVRDVHHALAPVLGGAPELGNTLPLVEPSRSLFDEPLAPTTPAPALGAPTPPQFMPSASDPLLLAPTPTPAQVPQVSPRIAPLEIDTENVVPPSIQPSARPRWPLYSLVAVTGAGLGVLAFFYVNGAFDPQPVSLPVPIASEPVASTTADVAPPVESSAPVASAPPVESSAPVIASAAPEPKPEPKTPALELGDKYGMLDATNAGKDRRIWVNGKLVGQTGEAIKVLCGTQSVKIGSSGTPRDVVVPCGGSVPVR